VVTSPWSRTATGVRLRLRVQPRSSRERVAGLHGDAIKLQVTAPPVEGAANEAVVGLVARWLGVPRRAVTLVHGHAGRDKVVDVATSRPAELAVAVERALAEFVDNARPRG
jgi:uncharacterized protein (TIGR00251 family)